MKKLLPLLALLSSSALAQTPLSTAISQLPLIAPKEVAISGVAGSASLVSNAYAGTQSGANYGRVSHQINALEDFGSFGDANTHFGVVVNGGKSVSTANTTGSWQLFLADYTGYGGASAASFITAGLFNMEATPSSFNKNGQYSALNSVIKCASALTPNACVSYEADVYTLSTPANVRAGVRVVDTASASGTLGVITDGAITVGKGGSALGFRNGLLFGDEGQSTTFPIVPGGQIINTAPSAVALSSFIDFSKITGVPTSAALSLPANIREACFGAVGTCGGGSILSTTSANGGALVFSNNALTVNWASAVFILTNGGNLNIAGGFGAQGLNTPLQTPPSSSGACTAGDWAHDASYVYTCVATNTWKRVALGAF